MAEKDKIEPTDTIKAIRVGSKDQIGNTITDVLALGDEYAIM